MTDLLLDSLEIKNFRCFDHLTVERLGRVNLLVGRNGVGKTALLEAVHLYASAGSPEAMLTSLWSRGELRGLPAGAARGVVAVEAAVSEALRHLVAGRPPITATGVEMMIGPCGSDEHRLRLVVTMAPAPTLATLAAAAVGGPVHSGGAVADSPVDPSDESRLHVQRTLGDVALDRLSAPPVGTMAWAMSNVHLPRPVESVGVNGLDEKDIARLWNGMLTGPVANEERVHAAVRVAFPAVKRVAMLVGTDERLVVRLTGQEPTVPLGSIGDGARRAVGLALALNAASGGVLLVDEFENGLHYQAMVELWRLVIGVAQELNVQVFATTHSWDCIEAFQTAAAERADVDGVLVRLAREGGEIVATLFDEDELAVVTRSDIEVR